MSQNILYIYCFFLKEKLEYVNYFLFIISKSFFQKFHEF